MRMCIVLLESGSNFTAFEKGDEISDDPSTCLSSNRRLEEDWADDSPTRHTLTHFQWMKAHFLVHMRVCGRLHSLMIVNLVTMPPSATEVQSFTSIRQFQFLKHENAI